MSHFYNTRSFKDDVRANGQSLEDEDGRTVCIACNDTTAMTLQFLINQGLKWAREQDAAYETKEQTIAKLLASGQYLSAARLETTGKEG